MEEEEEEEEEEEVKVRHNYIKYVLSVTNYCFFINPDGGKCTTWIVVGVILGVIFGAIIEIIAIIIAAVVIVNLGAEQYCFRMIMRCIRYIRCIR